MNLTIDINCDMGEGFPYDREIMPFITSANIACGYHAGNRDLIKKTIELAMKHKVAIGAHPSFPDREHFGRTEMHLEDAELQNVLSEQLYIFESVSNDLGISLHHIKLHGALYNMAANNEAMAQKILGMLFPYKQKAILYGLSGSIFNRVAQRSGFRVAHEVFADRTYQAGGILTPRSEANALISDEEQAVYQVLQMVLEKRVKTTSGTFTNVQADTVCIHGDTRYAAQFAQRLYSMVTDNFITLSTPQK
jgi:5-oxoprolinase (ATP-hydrolysing) subunit A